MTKIRHIENVLFLCLAVVYAVSAALVFRPVRFQNYPTVAALRFHNPKTTSLMEIRRRQFQKRGKDLRPRFLWVPLNRISPHLREAVIAAEDGGFYRHQGVEWGLVREALMYDLKNRRWARGASTITQQLARNLYLSPSKNPLRKLRELFITYRLEKALSKDRILEIYLNVVEWGNGIFGAEAASRAYFRKPAADLTLEEAVSLAAVLPSPRRHNPLDASGWVARRREWVYRRLERVKRVPESAETEEGGDAVLPGDESNAGEDVNPMNSGL